MSDARDQRFELRLSPAELDAYRLAAAKADVPLSEWIRLACSRLLERPVETTRQRRARLLEELEDELSQANQLDDYINGGRRAG